MRKLSSEESPVKADLKGEQTWRKGPMFRCFNENVRATSAGKWHQTDCHTTCGRILAPLTSLGVL